ncbi:MAG TPA: HWE histidine kinase domain-containing protein [Caulobacteraceae bacterium]
MAAHWLFSPALAANLPFITFFPAVLISAVWGGLAGGVTATVLSMVLGTMLFLPHPPHASATYYLAPLTVMLVTGIIIILVGETLMGAARAVVASEDRLRLLVKATSAFVVRLDRSGERLYPSPDWRDFTGQKYERKAGAWRDVLHPDDAAAFPKLEAEPVLVEARIRHALSDSYRWARLSLVPVRRGGEVREWLVAVEDIHARKVTEEHGKTLADELAHRARNGIAVVQAIVNQSCQGAANTEALRDAIIERLEAMSRAQAALDLTKGETAPMGEIIEQALTPFDRGRFDVMSHGAVVVLERQPAVTLALILYEMATNAVKYGALSAPGGRVAIEHGPRDQGLVSLSWRESGGPPVKAVERRGFGHRLLAAGPANLGGSSEIKMDPAGVTAQLRFRA